MKIGEKNVGMTDRIIRIVFGLILIVASAMSYVPGPWSYLVTLIGLILLVDGAVGTFGIFSVLGMSTLEKTI